MKRRKKGRASVYISMMFMKEKKAKRKEKGLSKGAVGGVGVFKPFL